MIEALTQEQRWGLAYGAQLLNEFNSAQDNGKPTDWTAETFAAMKLKELADQLWSEAKEAKWKIVREMVDSLPAEQLESLLRQFQIPDVIKQ